MSSQQTLTSILTIALTVLAMHASAAEMIQLDTTAFVVENSNESASIAGFTLADNSNRTLVVTVGGERSDTIASLQFDGTPLTQAAINHTGQTHASVWYLDLADTGGAVTGDIDLTWSGTNNGFYLGAFSLYDVQSGGPVATDNDGADAEVPLTLDYASTAAGDFIIESAASQQGQGTAITSPVELTELYNETETSGGGYSAAAAYDAIIAGGARSHTWDFDTSSSPRVRAAGAQFTAAASAAVPEPASVAIWSLIGLSLVSFGIYRRRRK